jgi:hypothetical protein
MGFVADRVAQGLVFSRSPVILMKRDSSFLVFIVEIKKNAPMEASIPTLPFGKLGLLLTLVHFALMCV